jgi:hypothetical protein
MRLWPVASSFLLDREALESVINKEPEPGPASASKSRFRTTQAIVPDLRIVRPVIASTGATFADFVTRLDVADMLGE